MGATPSQHLSNGAPDIGQWPIQDEMGIVVALPSARPPVRSVVDHQAAAEAIGHEYLGRRVLEIVPGSPAAGCGLVPWFDYIVGVNNRLYTEEDAEASLAKGLEVGKKAKLHVYNVKCQLFRECTITPITTDNHLFLGLKVSLLVQPDVEAANKCLRVLYLAKNSPAAEAGLEVESDYLLGSREYGAFTSLDDLETAVIEKEDKSFDVYIYNSNQDDVRVRTIRPRIGWSEDGGLLGAELASGILHSIPKTCRRTCGKDRETLGEIVQESEMVRTSEGVGQLLETHEDGSLVVRLDWGLQPGVQIVGKFKAKNVEPVAAAN